jgi:hypothetical protein
MSRLETDVLILDATAMRMVHSLMVNYTFHFYALCTASREPFLPLRLSSPEELIAALEA